MPPVGFERTISADERPQTHALDRAATGTGRLVEIYMKKIQLKSSAYSWYFSLKRILFSRTTTK
jgi:hypothetical protein